MMMYDNNADDEDGVDMYIDEDEHDNLEYDGHDDDGRLRW